MESFHKVLYCAIIPYRHDAYLFGPRFSQNQYHKWCLENSFESKLPGDVQKRNQQLKGIADKQKTLDDSLVEKPEKERVIAYSDLTFQRAAIEWMILTDQV